MTWIGWGTWSLPHSNFSCFCALRYSHLLLKEKKIQIFCVRAVRTFQQNKSIPLQCWHWQFLNRCTFKAAECKVISSWEVEAGWKNLGFALFFTRKNIATISGCHLILNELHLLIEESSALLFLSLALPFFFSLMSSTSLFMFVVLNWSKWNLESVFHYIFHFKSEVNIF